MKITIDFDGTCVTNEYPLIGKSIGAESVLKKLVQQGHKLILFTMRNDDYLLDAIEWFHKNNIKLYGVNKDPNQEKWTNSPKANSDINIDDRDLNIPLITNNKISDKPFVNWKEVNKILIEKQIL
ncbi:hypothetical protein M0Q97_03500 [Candidatus Dojkabacteria bacterium]|jgi:hypothetical protein|nr:hypothetical protein [Candidatus Dojkabacteria bacterium]